MVEPFGAAGLVLAGLTLPAQVFSSCVLAYTTVSDIRTTGRQFSRLFWLFKLQHTRFLVWGQNSDIYDNGISPEKLSQPVYKMVITTLMQIRDLLQDIDKLGSYYGLQRLPDASSAEPLESDREITRQATVVFKVQKSCSLLRKLRWAVADANNFSNLIQQLTKNNDALYEFFPLIQRSPQTAAVDAEALALAIVDGGWQGVQDLRQALTGAETGMRHNAALGPMSHLFAQTGAYIQGVGVTAVETGNSQEPFTFRPAPSLYLSFRDFQLQSSDSPRRSQARFRSSHNYVPINALIEWRPYKHHAMNGPRKYALQRRVEALASMLKDSPKNPSIRILGCLGYLEDDTRTRFGVAFQYPHPFVNEPECVAKTLNQILRDKNHPLPFLEDRFRLAIALAESLYEFHSTRWLHKGVSSHNILFFSQNNAPQNLGSGNAVRLPDPYFSGFTLSRPDDPEAVSELACPDLEIGIYQHPDIQGLLGSYVPSFHYIYDIYSLGAVLLEIGTWSPLMNLYQKGQNGIAFRNRLLRKVPLLGVTMGERYMDAARKCLECRFDGMRLFQDSERDTEDFILNLHRSFYWEIVKVLKEYSV
ncbi:hypothetical protein K458DRAFT_435306 [Lentithecium fluviatile CBS 122367]|uniref:Uncharacterized protein n=1 Tax=Lentithecium fluviatile CBS 122367 TaxID=1168545 RepID=A0A6G1ILF2_9PLEO|nr:hypothetical protein K458DRAFT_435306 [Lentithecium fluviatile CBS 122367]